MIPNTDDFPFLVQIALEVELWEELQARALVDDVTPEDILRQALAQYLNPERDLDP